MFSQFSMLQQLVFLLSAAASSTTPSHYHMRNARLAQHEHGKESMKSSRGGAASQHSHYPIANRCLDTESDPKNCGACGNVCLSSETCVLGACDSAVEQFTPPIVNYDEMDRETLNVDSVTDHSPTGVGWADFTAWDGKPVNPANMTRDEFSEWICPRSIPRGIKEVYYLDQPFKNPRKPTKAEIDYWHRRTIRHLRRLVGISEKDVPMSMDHCLSARATWGQEYRFSNRWGNHSEECAANPHCGAKFFPSTVQEQAPYFPDGYFRTHQLCTSNIGGAEGNGNTNTDIPWSIKVARVPCSFIAHEGYTGGHVGPFFRRTVGAFDVTPQGRSASVRGKWTGDLKCPKIYEGTQVC